MFGAYQRHGKSLELYKLTNIYFIFMAFQLLIYILESIQFVFFS